MICFSLVYRVASDRSHSLCVVLRHTANKISMFLVEIFSVFGFLFRAKSSKMWLGGFGNVSVRFLTIS